MVASIHKLLKDAGYQFDVDGVRELELGYIGGLLGLDMVTDAQARAEIESEVRSQYRRPTQRKG